MPERHQLRVTTFNRHRGGGRVRGRRSLKIQHKAISVETDDPPLDSAERCITRRPDHDDLVDHAAAAALEIPGCLDVVAAVEAKAGDLLAREVMHLLEPDGLGKAEQSSFDPDAGKILSDQVVTAKLSALIGLDESWVSRIGA